MFAYGIIVVSGALWVNPDLASTIGVLFASRLLNLFNVIELPHYFENLLSVSQTARMRFRRRVNAASEPG